MPKKKHPEKNFPIWQWVIMFMLSLVVIFLSLQFHARLVQFRTVGLIGIFLINLLGSLTLFLPAPAIATVIAGGALYSPILVGLIASLGAAIGDSLGYALGYSGSKLVSLKGEWYRLLIELFEHYGGLMIFLFAFFPNPFFDAVGIIAGVLRYPWQRFFLWLFLGRLCRNLLLAFFGVHLHTMWL